MWIIPEVLDKTQNITRDSTKQKPLVCFFCWPLIFTGCFHHFPSRSVASFSVGASIFLWTFTKSQSQSGRDPGDVAGTGGHAAAQPAPKPSGTPHVPLLPRGEGQGESQGDGSRQALQDPPRILQLAPGHPAHPTALPALHLFVPGLLAASLALRAQLRCHLLQKHPRLAWHQALSASFGPHYPSFPTFPHQPWSFLRAGHMSPSFSLLPHMFT